MPTDWLNKDFTVRETMAVLVCRDSLRARRCHRVPSLCRDAHAWCEALSHAAMQEPLYLTDKPRWEEDTRTEWERRYPQLFRHKLESEGWPVAPTQSTVRLPGITRT